jgi:polysaccharide pyruvyl transferase WcaK-like protein
MTVHVKRILSSEKTFCLFGTSLSLGNQGCRALTVSLIKLIKIFVPDAKIILLESTTQSETKKVLFPDRDVEIDVIHYRLSPKSNLSSQQLWIFFLSVVHRIIPIGFIRRIIIKSVPVLQAIENADFIGDIRGGDSFSDIYGLKRMVLGSMMPISAILMRKKLVLLPQTYGPYKFWISRVIARYLMKHSGFIMARDKFGVDYIKEDLLKNHKNIAVNFCPDVAFTLDPIEPSVLSVKPPFNKSKYIGINISGLLYNGGYSKKNMFGLHFDYKQMISKLVASILDSTESDVVLIPHVFSKGVENDYDACLEVYEKVNGTHPGRVHVVCGQYDQSQIKSIIGRCDFFIGSRMHACIAAVSQHIPCIGIAYSRKFFGVFESVGLGSFIIDGRSVDEQKLIEICLELMKRREKASEVLNQNVILIKEKLLSEFRDLFKHYTF